MKSRISSLSKLTDIPALSNQFMSGYRRKISLYHVLIALTGSSRKIRLESFKFSALMDNLLLSPPFNQNTKTNFLVSMARYGIFIIEFLRAEDYTDGENLHEILKLSLIDTKYKWVESKEGFQLALNEFQKSNYRYLHISCHADETGFEINGDKISNKEFQKMSKKHLRNKRLFLSACKGGNREIASLAIAKNKAYSVVGIPTNLPFDKSAIFWPSFYHVMNELDSHKMSRIQITKVIKTLVTVFKIPVNYYSRIQSSESFIRRLKIRHDKTLNQRIKVLQ